jgi:beta-glucosidase
LPFLRSGLGVTIVAMAKMIFPPDFLWGTATSSYQVEGNNRNNDWWAWEQEGGHVLHDQRCGLACNWWENAEADLDRAAEMGINAHRISIEWSRVEPEPSVFDEQALDRYRQILQAMHERGIEPMVALHHFCNPLWLVEKGDFSSDIVVDYFQRYTAKVVAALGDLVPKWLTLNEPMVYVFMRYLSEGSPPPKQRGVFAAVAALRNLLRCHAAAYHTIKELYPEAQVGVAKNMPVFQAVPGGGVLAKWTATQIDGLYNDSWWDSLQTGKVKRPFGGGRIKHLAGSFDFVGINYYTRYYVKFPPGRQGVVHDWGDEAVVSDGGYGEVYPAGLFQMIKRVLPYQKPIYITENGLPDQADRLRPAFLLTHLREVWRAISFCFPVMGYYHWSLVDNFEWDRGWTQRFGLIEMNPETQVRTLRQSGRLYQEICQNYAISSDMAARYAPEALPVLFPGQAPRT